MMEITLRRYSAIFFNTANNAKKHATKEKLGVGVGIARSDEEANFSSLSDLYKDLNLDFNTHKFVQNMIMMMHIKKLFLTKIVQKHTYVMCG